MDDHTYLLGKLAALESALEAAISTHPEPDALIAALSRAMSDYKPETCPSDVRSFAEGWMAVVTPLLTEQASDAETPVRVGLPLHSPIAPTRKSSPH
ncbi:hypothetical protein ACQKIE_01290 [Luteibacter sp. NPDC031894]|uniref:hypothetical protein n=1 Tax=Luteibacter sp. NPDC031894 TaxID=3390572 RepID=UPI003D035909